MKKMDFSYNFPQKPFGIIAFRRIFAPKSKG